MKPNFIIFLLLISFLIYNVPAAAQPCSPPERWVSFSLPAPMDDTKN